MASKLDNKPTIFIVGETASGKTAAGIELAQMINGEIICADSRTVYKQMNIGTAKPSKSEQKKVKHHLIDVVEPNEQFSAAKFKELAEEAIVDIIQRDKIPIIVGGTGLYIDALLYDFQFSDVANTTYRNLLEQMDDDELTTILEEKNIDTTRLNVKNRRHVIRAIERGENPPINNKLRKNTLVVGLTLDKEALKQRVEKRVENMFDDGFLEEVLLLSQQYGWDVESMSGIGYRVAREYFVGTATIEDVKSAFIKRDLSLAKRQRTWFKRNQNIIWFDNAEDAIKKAVEFVSGFDYN